MLVRRHAGMSKSRIVCTGTTMRRASTRTLPVAMTMFCVNPAEHSKPGSGRICQFRWTGRQWVNVAMMAASQHAMEIPTTTSM